jgi:hypothetical protein
MDKLIEELKLKVEKIDDEQRNLNFEIIDLLNAHRDLCNKLIFGLIIMIFAVLLGAAYLFISK